MDLEFHQLDLRFEHLRVRRLDRELAAGVRRGHVRRSRRDVYGGFRLLPTSAGEV